MITSAILSQSNKLYSLAIGAIVVTCCVGLVHSQSTECEEIIQLHSFLKNAGHECKYEYYGYRDDDLKKCIKTLSESEFEDIYREGAFAFDRKVEEKGMKQTCREALKDFPGIIRNER